jgi:hypothetical protein
MSDLILRDGDPFIYMKVGIHAREQLVDIIRRKREEIANAGVAFWGYGGGTCHPLTAVRPFVKEVTAQGTTVRLLMQEINSMHFAEQVRADSYSVNGIDWVKIPPTIKVLGSRYALVLSSLEEVDLKVALEDTKVGVGKQTGKQGSEYVRGRVDKACLVFAPSATYRPDGSLVSLRLAAKLAEPYAVLLK